MPRSLGKIWIWIIPVAIVAAGIFYYFFDPATSVLAPKCTGCGFQRAAHAFLHGRVLEAVSYNLFFIIAIPYFLILLYSTLMMHREHPSRTTVRLYDMATSRYAVFSYIVLYLIWWVVRNIIGM